MSQTLLAEEPIGMHHDCTSSCGEVRYSFHLLAMYSMSETSATIDPPSQWHGQGEEFAKPCAPVYFVNHARLAQVGACRGRRGTSEVYPTFQICLDRFTHKLTLDFLGA